LAKVNPDQEVALFKLLKTHLRGHSHPVCAFLSMRTYQASAT